MSRKAKPFEHQGHYYTKAGGVWRKLCPVQAGFAEASRILATLMAPAGSTVADAFERFLTHARGYYRLPSGKPSDEAEQFRYSFRELLAVAGSLPAASLSREHLKVARDKMIEAGLARRVINQRIGRIKRAARWLAEEGIVPDSVAASLALLSNLKPHRSAAAERAAVKPVDYSTLVRTLSYLAEPWASIARLQWWSGLRPGEACGLLVADVAGSSDGLVIDYGNRHKMAYRGRSRVVSLGPQASLVLLPWLVRAARVKRPNVFQSPSRRTKNAPDVRSYNHAIDAAINAAGVTSWTPNQIRHAFATRVRAAFGLEAAGAAIGHDKLSATEIYAERDRELALRVARRLG